jgi:cephalosporin hydroxylase
VSTLPKLRPVEGYDLAASWATFADGDYETTTLGDVRTWKLTDDLLRYEEIIKATKPEVVIETGTKFGGSAMWFASLGLHVITIDIDPANSQAARDMLGEKWPFGEIDWLTGDTLDPAVIAQAVELARGRRTMVSLDSEHAAPHVVREIQEYGQLVTPGCHLVVEDGIFDLIEPERAHLGGARIPLEGGPLKAISQVLVGDPLWQRDAKVERMSARSHHVAGFWLRKEPRAPRAAKAPKGTGALTAS